MRHSVFVGAAASVLLLAACSGDSDENGASAGQESAATGEQSALEKAEKEATLQAAEDGKIDCALGNETEFVRKCDVERIADDDGQILVVRHPDGGFRRFLVLTDGRGLELAEGFNDVELKILDNDMIEVESGGNSYRLPAQIKKASSDKSAETATASDETKSQ